MSRPAGPTALTGPSTPPSTRRFSRAELVPRVASAVILMAVALLSAKTGGWLFDLFWLAAAILVLCEWLEMVGSSAIVLPFAGALALVAAAILAANGRAGTAFAALVLGIGACLALPAPARRLHRAAGVLYAGVPLVAVILLRRSVPLGETAILWLFAVVWGTDVMAFFGGRLVGGPKLAPRLSPSKTWAGFLIGTGSGALIGLVAAPRPSCLPCLALLGLAAGMVAQGGDLAESMLKRRFGLKDSGRLIPGHGGFMDRLDGFSAALCLAALVGVARGGIDGMAAGLFGW